MVREDKIRLVDLVHNRSVFSRYTCKWEEGTFRPNVNKIPILLNLLGKYVFPVFVSASNKSGIVVPSGLDKEDLKSEESKGPGVISPIKVLSTKNRFAVHLFENGINLYLDVVLPGDSLGGYLRGNVKNGISSDFLNVSIGDKKVGFKLDGEGSDPSYWYGVGSIAYNLYDGDINNKIIDVPNGEKAIVAADGYCPEAAVNLDYRISESYSISRDDDYDYINFTDRPMGSATYVFAYSFNDSNLRPDYAVFKSSYNKVKTEEKSNSSSEHKYIIYTGGKWSGTIGYDLYDFQTCAKFYDDDTALMYVHQYSFEIEKVYFDNWNRVTAIKIDNVGGSDVAYVVNKPGDSESTVLMKIAKVLCGFNPETNLSMWNDGTLKMTFETSTVHSGYYKVKLYTDSEKTINENLAKNGLKLDWSTLRYELIANNMECRPILEQNNQFYFAYNGLHINLGRDSAGIYSLDTESCSGYEIVDGSVKISTSSSPIYLSGFQYTYKPSSTSPSFVILYPDSVSTRGSVLQCISNASDVVSECRNLVSWTADPTFPISQTTFVVPKDIGNVFFVTVYRNPDEINEVNYLYYSDKITFNQQ